MEEGYLNNIYNHDCISGMRGLIENYGEGCVDMTLTDIPYDDVTHYGKERAKYSGQLRDLNKDKADEPTFDLYEFIELVYKITRGTSYIFCSPKQVSDILRWFEDKKDVTVRQCIWHKTNPSPANGQHYWLNSFENCVFIKKRKTTFNQHCKHSVWDFPAGTRKIHPTQKNINLFKYLIESSSNENEVIFDPCMGSGTTAVAAKELNRKYIGFELDKKYFDLANERIEKAV